MFGHKWHLIQIAEEYGIPLWEPTPGSKHKDARVARAKSKKRKKKK